MMIITHFVNRHIVAKVTTRAPFKVNCSYFEMHLHNMTESTVMSQDAV